MIEVKIKVHDKYSFEVKTSFLTNNKEKEPEQEAEFNINMWMFMPSNLDITRSTYSKEQFYRDIKSNIRLITPVFSLSDIYKGENAPIARLKKAINDLAINQISSELEENYTYQIKMFLSIVKSAVRDKVLAIGESRDDNWAKKETKDLFVHLTEIISLYQSCWFVVKTFDSSFDLAKDYLFGEEFLGNVVEQHIFLLMRQFEDKPFYDEIKPSLVDLSNKVISYKKEKGFPVAEMGHETANRLMIIRRHVLKKYIESDLYLNIKKLKDGALVQQFYYGVAAGISMIFATVVSFIAQLRYGNFTTPLFFALVISYIFKDRIKELMRYYFSNQLGKKYFDTKRKLAIRNEEIGWAKEAFDFVEEEKVPEEVMEARNKSPLMEAENKIYGETILLYRKHVMLSPEKIETYKEYKLAGINDITKFSVLNFTRKMDNSDVPLFLPDDELGYIKFDGTRVYTLYFIIRCQGRENVYLKQYRLLFNRDGIKEISEISSHV